MSQSKKPSDYDELTEIPQVVSAESKVLRHPSRRVVRVSSNNSTPTISKAVEDVATDRNEEQQPSSAVEGLHETKVLKITSAVMGGLNTVRNNNNERAAKILPDSAVNRLLLKLQTPPSVSLNSKKDQNLLSILVVGAAKYSSSKALLNHILINLVGMHGLENARRTLAQAQVNLQETIEALRNRAHGEGGDPRLVRRVILALVITSILIPSSSDNKELEGNPAPLTARAVAQEHALTPIDNLTEFTESPTSELTTSPSSQVGTSEITLDTIKNSDPEFLLGLRASARDTQADNEDSEGKIIVGNGQTFFGILSDLLAMELTPGSPLAQNEQMRKEFLLDILKSIEKDPGLYDLTGVNVANLKEGQSLSISKVRDHIITRTKLIGLSTSPKQSNTYTAVADAINEKPEGEALSEISQVKEARETLAKEVVKRAFQGESFTTMVTLIRKLDDPSKLTEVETFCVDNAVTSIKDVKNLLQNEGTSLLVREELTAILAYAKNIYYRTDSEAQFEIRETVDIVTKIAEAAARIQQKKTA